MPATLSKRDLNTGFFLGILQNIWEHLFLQNTSDDSFCYGIQYFNYFLFFLGKKSGIRKPSSNNQMDQRRNHKISCSDRFYFKSIAKHSEIDHFRLAMIPKSVSNIHQRCERYCQSNIGPISKTSYVLQISSSDYSK